MAVVTGASSGIGAASARRLAAEGYEVVCAARRADRIEALAAAIDGRAVVCDVTSEDDVAALAEAVGPRCDLLVNNAGGALGADAVAEADLAGWRAMYETNVIGVVAVTKALLPALVAAGGTIVVIGSTAGQATYEGGGGHFGMFGFDCMKQCFRSPWVAAVVEKFGQQTLFLLPKVMA